MIVHIDKLIRHLRSQIESATKLDSEFVYITRREAEGCLELAEAQDVIQEMFSEKSRIVRCRIAGIGSAAGLTAGTISSRHGVRCSTNRKAQIGIAPQGKERK